MKTFLKLMSMEPAGGDAPPVFRITSPNLDRHKDRVLAIKADGEEFRVPLLWNHDDWNPAIGVARCYREGDQWLMTPIFDGACETSRMVGAKVKAGTLNQCSIRLVPVQEPVPNAEGGYDFPMVTVPEVSIVNIAANEEAVRLRSARSGGRPSAPGGGESGLLKQMARRMKHLQAQMDRLLKALGEDEEKDLDEEEKDGAEDDAEKDLDDAEKDLDDAEKDLDEE
ncbi:primosomal replication protein N, partial [Myxococcus sp. 1LA]